MATFVRHESSDGAISYHVKIRLKGVPPQFATFKRLTDAKRWAQSIEAAIREGRYFKTSEAKRHTLAEMVDRYTNEVIPTKPKNAINTKRNLNWWKNKIGKYTLADVTPALIAQCRDALLSSNTCRGTRRSPSTVVRYLAALSHAFTIAVKEWGWLDDTPMRKVSKPKPTRGRVRFLDDAERDRLMTACKESKNRFLYTITVLAISTGMRKGEIMSLRWNQIDIKRNRITLHETKNDERRAVALVGHACEQIKELSKIRRIDTDLLFPGLNPLKAIDISSSWYTALKKSNIEDFRFHDLRHCTASYLAMNGASLAEIAEVLGHKTLQMVKRYSHISDSHTANVVEKMNHRIFNHD